MRHKLTGAMVLAALAAAPAPAVTDHSHEVLMEGYLQALRKDGDSARAAAVALAKMGPQAEPAAGALVEALRYDEEAVSAAVGDALVGIGAPSVAPLQRILGDSNFMVRRRAADILARLGPQAASAASDLVPLLRDPQFEVQAAVQKALVQMGDAAMPALAEGLKSKEEGSRRLILSTLSQCGPAAAPLLIKLLKTDDNAFIRASAADALGAMPPATPGLVAALTRGLSDLQDGVRGASADALGELGEASTAAIASLRVVAQGDSDALARQKAANALARISPAGSPPPVHDKKGE